MGKRSHMPHGSVNVWLVHLSKRDAGARDFPTPPCRQVKIAVNDTPAAEPGYRDGTGRKASPGTDCPAG